MDFQLTTEQTELRAAVREMCAGTFDIDTLRSLEGRGFDPARWQTLAEMGVFSLRVSEEAGGVGLGMADAVLVFEELGRAIVPGPVVWTHLAASLDGIGASAASGELVVGGIDLATDGPLLVEHWADLDALIALGSDEVRAYEPSVLGAEVLENPLDPLSPVAVVASLEGGDVIGDAATAARLRSEGTALVAAMQLGIAGAQTEQASTYALEREQFGRPIGSFQSIKHILADMLVRAEVARAGVYAAGVTLDDPALGDPERSVSAAKVCADEAAVENSKAGVQVHGGMGYTWEVPVHYYLKRAWLLATVFGSAGTHAERIAQAISTA